MELKILKLGEPRCFSMKTGKEVKNLKPSFNNDLNKVCPVCGSKYQYVDEHYYYNMNGRKCKYGKHIIKS